MLNNIRELEERRLMILEGIGHDLNSLEIAVKLGVDKWMIMRDLKTMKYNRDPELKQAYKDQYQRTMVNKRSSSKISDDRFHLMTGKTFLEKSFENMMNFYKPELIKIIMSRDENIAISSLSKNIQKVLTNNEIIAGGKSRRKITSKARVYLSSHN